MDIRKAYALMGTRLRRRFWLVVVVGIVGAVLESFNVAVVFGVLRSFVSPETLSGLPLIGGLDFVVQSGSNDIRYVYGAAILAVAFLLKNVFLGYVIYQQKGFSAFSSAHISQQLFVRYLNAPYEHIYRRHSAELINKIMNLARNVSGQVLTPLVELLTEIAMILGILAVLLVVEPATTAATIVACAVLIPIIYLPLRSNYSRWGRELAELDARCIKIVQEGMGSNKEIRIIGRQSFFANSFVAVRSAMAKLSQTVLAVLAMPRLITETLVIWVLAAIVIAAVLQGRRAEDVIVAIGVLAFGGFRMMPSMNRLIGSLSTFRLGRAPVEQIFDDLEKLPATGESPGAAGEPMEPYSFRDKLEARDLTYVYSGSSSAALDHASFEIRRGESIGLVGVSGAGKTTLVDILLGLLPPSGGTFHLDGRELETSSRSWRRLVGFVPQRAFIVDDTLCANIAFGFPPDEVDIGRVESAIKLAALDDVVDGLPEKLDTRLGEGGIRLSGGQLQRVAIARALYNDPEILVMDEATAALDSITERQIIDAIERLRGRKTIVMIAHRLSTVRHCDRILFMRQGRIVDAGSFTELRTRNPEFARIVQLSELAGGLIEDEPSNGGRHAAVPG